MEDINIEMKKTIQQKRILGLPFKIILTGVILLLIFFLVKELINNTDSISTIANSAGTLGPIVLIILIALGILFTPIPSILLILTAGYLYGIWEGALYSYLGHLIAATGTFAVVNVFNLHLENKRYEKYKKLVRENKAILFLLYTIPVIPVSIVTIIAASTKMKWARFLEIIFISFAPLVLFFSFFGNGISNQNLIEIGALAIIILIISIITFEIIKKKRLSPPQNT